MKKTFKNTAVKDDDAGNQQCFEPYSKIYYNIWVTF